MKRLLVLLLFLVAPAHAAVEFCGNGVDDSLETGGSAAGTYGSCPANYHNSLLGTIGYSTKGCDADCDAPDKDNDGYNSDGSTGNAETAYTDCDDTNGWIYPGVYTATGCNSGYLHYCDTDGVYKTGAGGSSAVANGGAGCFDQTTLDQSTNSGGRFYVDCGNSLGSASDSNAGTSYGAPELTLAACIADISAAGGVCYMIGTGTCTEAVTIAASGTSTHPRRLYRLPGSTAKMDSTSTTISLAGFDYWHFDYLDGNSRDTIIDSSISGSTGIELSRNFFHDIATTGTNNSMTRMQHSPKVNYHHNISKDAVRVSGDGGENVSHLMMLDDDGENSDHKVRWNTFLQSTYSVDGPQCLYFKHGTLASDVTDATVGVPVRWNTFTNCGGTSSAGNSISAGASKLRIFNNRFYTDSTQGISRFYDTGGATAHQDIQFKYNTVVQGGGISWTPLWYTGGSHPKESLTISHNVFQITSSDLTGDISGVFSICGRTGTCTSGNKTIFESNNYLEVDNNCYYTPNATANWSYFEESGVGSGEYNYTQWQAISGTPDSSSPALGDPGITVPKHQGTGNCASYGWSVTTTTTTTTASTTTTTLGTSNGYLAGRFY